MAVGNSILIFRAELIVQKSKIVSIRKIDFRSIDKPLFHCHSSQDYSLQHLKTFK